MEIYQIVLATDTSYIILENCKSLEEANYMLKWYKNHQKFFNGNFSIKEVRA